MPHLTCTVVTPEKTALEQRADFIALPLYDGELGVAPGRAPLIGRLGLGELRIRNGDQVSRFYLDGGFVEIAGNVVSVLTNHLIPRVQIDPETAKRRIAEALRQPITSPEQEQARDRILAQARAQLRVARSR